MPKTRNAFALKNFDGKKILQRPFFSEFGFDADKTDEEILSNIRCANDLAAFELENALLGKIFSRLAKFQVLIRRHTANRLDPYRRAIQKRTDATDTDCNFFQVKFDREQKLASFYIMDVGFAISDLIMNVHKRWQVSEQELQTMYRRRFGERLKTAREQAGLSRKDLGDAIHISPNGYGLYETGKRDVSTTALIRLARTLNISTDWLVGVTP